MKKSLIKYFIFFLLLVVLIFTISSTMAASDNSASNSKSIKNFIDNIINNIKGSIQGSFISNLFDNDGVKNDNVFVPLATETFPNEPAGFTRIAEFSPTILPPKSPPPNEASLAGCWLSGRSGQTGGPYIVSTPSPVTGNSAFKFVYGSGLTEATQDPGGISGWQSCSQHEQYPEIYESGYFRVGEENQKTFEMLTFGFKALGYWGAGAVGDVCECQVYNVISAQQPTPGQVSSFWFNLYNQGGGSDGKAYSSNAGDGTITVGQWYRYEIYMKINDIGQANGIMTAWLNGKKVLDYNTVQFRNSVHNRMFFGRELDPIYGGRIPSGSKTQTDNLYFDRIYISARGFGTPPPITTSAPIVSLSASPTSINTGQSSTLAWSSTGATSCTASGGTFTGTKALSSSQSVLPTTNTTYTLTCIGAGGSTSKSTMVTVSQQAPTETGNLPVNPSFETGTAGNADTWTESSSHTRSSDRARTGAYSLKSTFRSSGGSGVATDQTLNVFPNTNYTYSGWIYKAATSGSAYLDMNDILGELQLYTSLTNTWQKVSGTWNSGTNTNVKLRLVTDGSMNGDVWFDEIELIPGGVTPPPPPLVTSGSYLNEPLGFERLAEINFSSLPGKTGSWDRAENQLAGSWYRRPYDVHTIIASDSSAPQSPQGILRARFPAGLVGGESSVFFGGASSDQQPQRELYVSVQMRIEGSDYQNQKVFTKLWYLPYMNRNRNNHATLGLLGNGTQEAIRSAFPLVYSLSEVDSLTGTDPGHSTPRYQNRGKRQFTVGPWHQIEMYLKQNTFGATPNPDGVLLIWLDGELVMDYRDIRWSSAQNPLGFYEFHADMIYGGVGGIRTRDDYIDFDHIYISGSSASTLPPSTTDTTPPIVTIIEPTSNQVLPTGTTGTLLSVTTNEVATCKYGNSNQDYDIMPNTFTTTGTTSQSRTTISGLVNGQNYNYYVRCADAAGNKNTASTTISFSVASVVPVCGDNICNGNENSASCPVDCSLICDITSASWSKNSSVEGDVVYLNVFGNNCNGKTVSFDVKEKDFASDLLGGDDPINANPLNVVFNGASASGTWVSEWQDDGLAGTAGDPEYYFTATVVGTNEQMQSGTNDFEMLHVTQKKSLPSNPGTPQFSVVSQNSDGTNVLVKWDASANATSYRYASGFNSPINTSAIPEPEPMPTPTPIVPPPAPSSGNSPNQPAGFSPWLEHDFQTLPNNTPASHTGRFITMRGGTGNYEIVTDTSTPSPRGGSKVLRIKFPKGMVSGVDPGAFFGHNNANPSTPLDEWYTSFWVKFDGSDWEWPPAAQKLWYTSIGNRELPSYGGTLMLSTGNSKSSINPGPVYTWVTNRKATEVVADQWYGGTPGISTDGKWHHIEFYGKRSTPDVADGRRKVWIDGIKTLDVAVQDQSFTNNWLTGFFEFHFSPVWGGVCDPDCPKTRDDFMRIAHLYISGKPVFGATLPPPPAQPTVTCPTTVPSGTFQACYYDNKDFTSLKLTKTESTINFDWGSGSPDSTIGVDTFSAKWEGDFTFENAIYNFSAIVDDGVRLYIDNNILIDKWLDQAPTTYTATKTMTPGAHRVKVEYYENGIGATAKVSWAKGQTAQPLPPPPPTTISRPNEPSGFTRIIENNFNLIPSGTNGIAGSWWSDSNVRIVSDNSAPVSSPNVLQFKFPTGLRAGDGN